MNTIKCAGYEEEKSKNNVKILSSFLFKIKFAFLTKMPDLYVGNDVNMSPCTCTSCEWNGLIEHYEVKQSIYFYLMIIWCFRNIFNKHIQYVNIVKKDSIQ